ncbi:MAG TPA: ATP-binding protein [archaeon]|nr:ATP-binding protein [archaeon]
MEFKESFHSTQRFSEIMCGFANTYGGIIVLGVNNKNEIIGISGKIDEIQQKISATAQSVSPPLMPSIELHEVNGKKIIAIVVQRAIDNIFYTFQGVIWARIGSTTKKMEGNQIVEFLRGKQILCFDEIPSVAKIDDIDQDKVNEYLQIRGQADFLKTHSLEDFLLSMKLATKNGELKIKNAALLMFAKNPIFFNPQTEMKLVRFEGNEPVQIVSHELVQSDLIGGIGRALAFVKSNVSKSIQVKLDAKRTEKYEYPIDVIREAVVNAVAHRDYFSKDGIQIYLFSDRIEITNPGSLPQGLPKELFGTLSVQRNPLTYRILRDLGYVEGLGSGVPRMINSMRKHGLSDPDFGIYEQFFRVTFKNTKSRLKPATNYLDLNERQRKTMEFLRKNKSIKTAAYIKINDVSFGTARLDINEMIKLGYVEKIGTYKGAYYKLKNIEK